MKCVYELSVIEYSTCNWFPNWLHITHCKGQIVSTYEYSRMALTWVRSWVYNEYVLINKLQPCFQNLIKTTQYVQLNSWPIYTLYQGKVYLRVYVQDSVSVHI